MIIYLRIIILACVQCSYDYEDWRILFIADNYQLWWYWFPRGLLLNPGFVCLSWCFDLLRLAFTVDFHISNSCVNNHRILTASIKGNLEMFCLGEFCSIIFPILLFQVHLLKGRLHLAKNALNAFDQIVLDILHLFIFFKFHDFEKKVIIFFSFSLVI